MIKDVGGSKQGLNLNSSTLLIINLISLAYSLS